MANKIRTITLGFILSWIIGVLAILSGIACVSSSSVTSILFFVLAFIALPPANKLIEKLFSFRISGGLKFILVVLLLGFIGATAPNVAKENGASIDQQESSSSNSEAIKSDKKQSVQKTYQQIFTFQGNGAKKSEPFDIKGDRFKISYDCKGELCQAYLHKVGSSMSMDLIMNTASSTTDETIFYGGQGAYYIEANVMGKFKMIVYDYK